MMYYLQPAINFMDKKATTHKTAKRQLTILVTGLIYLSFYLFAYAVEIPNTPAGGYLNEYLSVFNSGDRGQWRAFILKDPKAADSAAVFDRRMGMFETLFNDLGGMSVEDIVKSENYALQCLVKARQPHGPFEWLKMGIELDPKPPHYLLGIDIKPTDNPKENIPESVLSIEDLLAYVDDYLGELTREDKFSGTVLIARDGRPLFKKAYGQACKRYNVPNWIDTKFNLGSMNKMFTGVAIGQLAEQGKLSFADPIIKYLPDYPNKEVAEKVTIHQLLTHTSGMDSYWEELWKADWWEIRSVQQLADLFVDKPLLFEPSERFHYSNSGPVVLGLIIERLTGQSYYDYIRENIYKPAGMENTDSYEMDRPVPNLAIGYTKKGYGAIPGDSTWRNNLYMHTVKGGPAGGGYSTVEDLLKFDIALRNHKLLTKEYTDIVTTGKVAMGDDMMYAYLFGDETINGQRIIGHNGGAPGISASLEMYLDSGYTVAVLANYDYAAEMVAQRIRNLLLKMK